MKVENLEAFLAVVDEKSISKAAKQTRSPISTIAARINELERHFGTKLFYKTKGVQQLTPKGISLVPIAENIVRLWAQSESFVSLPEGYTGHITIGSQVSLWQNFVFDITRFIQNKFPSLSISIDANYSKYLIERLESGALDFIVSYVRTSDSFGIRSEELFVEKIVLATRKENEKQAIKNIRPFIGINLGSRIRDRQYDDLKKKYPGMLSYDLSVNIGQWGVDYIKDIGGIGFLPYRMVKPFVESGELVTKDDIFYERPVYISYSKDRMKRFDSDVDGNFIDTIIEELKKMGEQFHGP